MAYRNPQRTITVAEPLLKIMQGMLENKTDFSVEFPSNKPVQLAYLLHGAMYFCVQEKNQYANLRDNFKLIKTKNSVIAEIKRKDGDVVEFRDITNVLSAIDLISKTPPIRGAEYRFPRIAKDANLNILEQVAKSLDLTIILEDYVVRVQG